MRMKIPLTFLLAGVGLMGVDWWQYLILLLTRTTTNVSPLDASVSIIAKIVGIILILFSVYWANRLMIRIEKKSSEKTKLVLKQFSINSSEKNDISDNPKSVIYIQLDQRQQEEESGVEWIKRSLFRQKDAILDVHYIVERWDHPILYYEGLAHIPFVFLLGYQLSNKRELLFTEWDENKKKWNVLPKTVDSYSSLHLHKQIIKPVKDEKEIAVCISLTEEIQDVQLKGLDAYHCNKYHLKLRTCKRHAIVCLDQLEEYTRQFRQLMDNINRTYPRLQKVHIFISAQTSLVFNVGSVLTRNDAEVWIYNFERNNNIQYPWGLRVHPTTVKNKIENHIIIAQGE